MKTSLLRWNRPQPAGEDILEEDAPEAAAQETAPLQAHWTGGSALATKAASGLLWAGLAAGPVALLLALSSVLASAPVTSRPTAPVVERVGEQAAATEFAGRLVALWLTSVRGQEAQLTPLLHDVQVSLPEVAWSAGPTSVADVHRLPDGTWTVVTAVPVGPVAGPGTGAPAAAASLSAVRAAGWPVRYFTLPVHVDAGGPVALALPAPVAAPGPAARPPDLSYRNQAVAADPIGVSVAQFLAALLTGSGDVTRYLSPGTAISAVTPAPYTAVTVTNIATDRELTAGAAVPPDGTRLRALVTATATAGPEQTATVQYPLTLTVRGGRWEVTAIDPAPALQPLAPTGVGSPAVTPAPASSTPTPTAAPATDPSSSSVLTTPLNLLD